MNIISLISQQNSVKLSQFKSLNSTKINTFLPWSNTHFNFKFSFYHFVPKYKSLWNTRIPGRYVAGNLYKKRNEERACNGNELAPIF